MNTGQFLGRALLRGLRPHSRAVLLWTGGVVIAFAVLGFLVAPVLVRPTLERKLSAALDRNVSIARLDINPFALSATLRDVVIGDGREGPALFTLAQLFVSCQVSSLFRWAPVISKLKLTQPALHLVRNEDKTYNFSDLLDRALAEPPASPPRFSVNNIEVEDGSIDFDDRREHEQHRITQLSIGIPFVSSLPTQAEVWVEPRFSALVNGRPVAISGKTRPFEDTHETVLSLDLTDLPLPTYIEYVPVPIPVKVDSGLLTAKAQLTFVGHGRDPPQLTLAGTFRLNNLVLNERSGARLLRVKSFDLALNRLDLIGQSADVGSVAVEGAELDVRRDSRGELNLNTLLSPNARATSAGSSFPLHVGSIAVRHGTLRLADAAVNPAFASTLSDVTIDITDLASAPDKKAGVTFSFETDTGARLSHRGMLGLSPVRADGRLELTGFRLDRLYPYYAGAINLAIDEGTLDGSTELHFDNRGGGAITLTNLDATANNLKMRLPDSNEPLWRGAVLAVHGGSVDVAKHAIRLELVESHGAVATIRRDADGNISFERLIRTHEAGAALAGTAETWHVETGRVVLDDFSATFNDETVTPPAQITLSHGFLTLEDLSNAPNAKGHAILKATVTKRGTVSIAGPIATRPFAATLNVDANGIDLVPFQPYITRGARVVVTGGTASAKGAVELATGTSRHAGFKGELTLGAVAVLDEANEADLLKWRSLALAGIDAQLEPLVVTVGNIALDDFFVRLMLNESGEFNLQQLGRHRTPAGTPATPTAESNTVQVAAPPGKAATWLKLGKATLTGGSVDFTDHFIRPNYSANLTGLTGSLSSVVFDQPANIELRGNVQGSAPVEISGRINPLAQNLFLDVKASATDISLPPLTPYSEKYVGYGIEKGKLSMKVSYHVEDRKLKAENSIVLDELTFGEKVESPDAIKAPVLLAVGLLKDRNGVINFDLPVEGSLDDPQFSVGGLVLRALESLIVKAVTAPFALLGSLSGHGEKLAYIEFAAGSAALDKQSEDKIKAVAKALIDRPAVKVDVAGRVDPAQDREALKRSAVDRQVRAQKFIDLVKGGEPPASVDAVEVPAAEYDALLTRAYTTATFTKPRNAIGLPKDLSRNEMEALLLANAAVSDEDLRSLAERRAEAVRASLINGEHVPEARVFLLAPKLDAQGIKDTGRPTRVDFAMH